MGERGFKTTIFLAISFLLGMMLAILPLPEMFVWCRPAWVLMILLFWVIELPHRVGVVMAFVIGLIMDLLTGTLFGQHAFAFTLVAYFFARFQVPIRSLPAWQQLILIFFSTLVYMAVQYWIMVIIGQTLATWKYWLPLITTTLLWPWMRLVLNDYQHRFEIK